MRSHNATTGHDIWLKPKEVSAITGYSPGYLAQQRMKGGGPPFAKMGKGKQAQVRYRQSDLDAWIESRMRASTSDTGEHAVVGASK